MKNKEKTASRVWIIQTLVLFLPFLLELLAYPLFMKITPTWLAGALFFILYTYVFYGAAILMYTRWRKAMQRPLIWKIRGNAKPLIIACLVGITYSHLGSFVFGASHIPMLISESFGYYFKMNPLIVGIAGYLLQLVYYFFEFTLVVCIVDCAQNAARQMKWPDKIPWGGLFLGLTWGLNHAITKGSIEAGLTSCVLSVCVGTVYVFFGKKPLCAWITIAAAYLL